MTRRITLPLVVVMLAFGCATTAPSSSTNSASADTNDGTRIMRGLFTYMADAALFTDCDTGKRHPVAMEADYLDLERAYLDSRPEPGAPLMVSIKGKIEPRPAMEGDRTEMAVIVGQFGRVLAEESCEPEEAVPLRETRWIFISVRGTRLALGSGPRRPDLVFIRNDDQVRGFGGCNQIGASFSLDGNRIVFGTISSTKMLCSPTPTMEIERNIIRALETTASYLIEEDRLILSNSNGVEVGLLEAQRTK